MAMSSKDKNYKNKQWIYQKYHKENLNLDDTARLAGCTRVTLVHWMNRFDIPRRTNSESKKMCYKTKIHHLRGKEGKDATQWKGGRNKTSRGYIEIYSPNHPHRRRKTSRGVGGYMLEHRLVMEKKVGRYLHPWEVVHHVNGIRDDNRIENLELLPNQGGHNTRIQEICEINKKTEELIAHLLEAYFLPEVLEYMKWAKERDEKLYRRIKERCLIKR